MGIIEFRVWDKEHKKMIKKIPLSTVNFYKSLDEFFIQTNIMQFIGHKDKNGKKIYIGDILNWENKCTILIKEKDELGFYYEVLTQKDKNIVSFDIRFYRSEESAEVIGNIYENSELMEEKKWELKVQKQNILKEKSL